MNTLTGDVVVLRYYDSVLFKDVTADSNIMPIVRETIGWVDYQDDDYMRIIWERYSEAEIKEESKLRITGLAILKKNIISIRKAI